MAAVILSMGSPACSHAAWQHRTQRGPGEQGRHPGVQSPAVPLHQPPAHRGVRVHRRHRAGGAVLVAYGVRRGELWAWVGAVAAPVLGLAVALPAHYPNHFDTLGHLGLIYLATVIFVVGALLALRGIITHPRR